MNTLIETTGRLPIYLAWIGFAAGAGAFGADLPSQLGESAESLIPHDASGADGSGVSDRKVGYVPTELP